MKQATSETWRDLKDALDNISYWYSTPQDYIELIPIWIEAINNVEQERIKAQIKAYEESLVVGVEAWIRKRIQELKKQIT